jgi:hypothetical protein
VAFTTKSVENGTGRHLAVLTPQQMSGAILWTMVAYQPSLQAFTVPKLAVIALLVRLLNPSRAHRIFLWTMGITCWLAVIFCNFLLFAQCTPSRSQWDFSVKGECWDHSVVVNYSIFAGGNEALHTPTLFV